MIWITLYDQDHPKTYVIVIAVSIQNPTYVGASNNPTKNTQSPYTTSLKSNS